MDVRAVQNGGYKDIVIKTSNETYISSDKNYFVGKTEDFLFNIDLATSTQLYYRQTSSKNCI